MRFFFLILVSSALLLFACGGGEEVQTGLSGTVSIDGSSTVFPITEAVAEEFQRLHPGVRVTVGISGTGGGFKKFTAGETDANDASRPISPSEMEAVRANGVEFIEFPVAYDGISLVVNPNNDFVDSLTVEELKKIWQPGSTVKSWNEVRPNWPDRPITLYAPGTDSGTFDYFTEVINGKSGACRPDFTASEDDNVLVQGIVGDENSLGFFGYAYFVENRSQLKLLSIDGGEGPVAPSDVTINNGTYWPLSRPLLLYLSQSASHRPEIQEFVEFYLDQAPVLVAEVGYVPLPDELYNLGMERFRQGVTGSVFAGESSAEASLTDLFSIRE